MAVPAAPKNVSASARKVWRSVLTDYELRTDEIELLSHYVRELTLVEQLEDAWFADPEALVPGSHGGLIANPILAEIRMHRGTVLTLWKGLKLPDLDAAGAAGGPKQPMSRTESAKKAAQARWGTGA